MSRSHPLGMKESEQAQAEKPCGHWLLHRHRASSPYPPSPHIHTRAGI